LPRVSHPRLPDEEGRLAVVLQREVDPVLVIRHGDVSAGRQAKEVDAPGRQHAVDLLPVALDVPERLGGSVLSSPEDILVHVLGEAVDLRELVEVLGDMDEEAVPDKEAIGAVGKGTGDVVV